ncbi:metal ABC transporter ATP-binding protein [Candidatus Uhrbacteria bacterium]|nr:metal ABC transporter ATP-binding protein [Candidatus Uhrbacteria bacterium]
MRARFQKIAETKALFVEKAAVCLGDISVLEDITFAVEPKSICAIIGPNGSGKTTLMKAMLGLIPFTSGGVLFFGKSKEEWGGTVGYVAQRFSFDRTFPLTVKELLVLSCGKTCTHGHIQEKLQEVGLPITLLHARLGTLSGGQLQRVLIAQALARNPDILFLDEPSTGIDTTGEQTIYSILKHLNRTHGTTILFISHDIGVVSDVVDQVICVNRRLLCEGPPKKTLTDATLSELYGSAGGSRLEHGERHLQWMNPKRPHHHS